MLQQKKNIIDFPKNDIDSANAITDENIRGIAIECLKKSEINGNPEKIANEYIKIFNMLKMQINNKSKRHIPEQTVFDDYIICLEDGKKMKMLKRHLKIHYHMTFQEYKQKWELPIDYPHTCKNYSATRAKIASKKKKTKN